jgi:multiple sugar transport system ATP-binding protein
MGRAIVREPAAFLMDEPLSNLDAKLRVEMRAEITTVQRRIGAPTLYVTHDQTEAMTMGDRVAILRHGVLEQLGTPLELYDAPVNAFVASFIGSPAMNLVEATVADGSGARFARFGGARLPIPRDRLGSFPGGRVRLGLRPEDLGRDGDGLIELPVARTESLGSETIVYLDAGDERPLTARVDRRAGLVAGEPARIRVDLDRLYFFDVESGEAIA